ncbi:MAG TPA: cupredoxin domain-containing protein [Blastocatellia bacterium]|nr:cupredoxin domain-containing protein [Blastocatellia bacterium]
MRKCLIIAMFAAPFMALFAALPPGLSSTSAGVAAQNKTTVRISNFKFAPQQITVPAGTTVVWVNENGRHTVEADKGEFKSPVLTEGKSFEFKFDKPGRYAYHCGFHGEAGGKDMAGTVVVTRKK